MKDAIQITTELRAYVPLNSRAAPFFSATTWADGAAAPRAPEAAGAASPISRGTL